jgi:hypothetical protein
LSLSLGGSSGRDVDVTLGEYIYARGTRAWLSFTVGYGWYQTVFRAGLAVIDGQLILAVLTEAELTHRRLREALGKSFQERWWVAPFGKDPDLNGGPYVLAVYEGPGYKLRGRPARVVRIPGPDGKTRTVLQPVAPQLGS